MYGLPFNVKSGSHYPPLTVGYSHNGNLPAEIRFLLLVKLSLSIPNMGVAIYCGQTAETLIPKCPLLITKVSAKLNAALFEAE